MDKEIKKIVEKILKERDEELVKLGYSNKDYYVFYNLMTLSVQEFKIKMKGGLKE